MELSKDEPIFKIIDSLKTQFKENKVIVKFLNTSGWSENEFNNFINKLRNVYSETIDEEYLEVILNDTMLKISKISNIINYCNTNSHATISHKWKNVFNVKTDTIDNLFDVNLEFNVSKYDNTAEMPSWETEHKRFKLIKQFNYDMGDGITAVAKILRDSVDSYLTLKKSKTFQSSQKYEFELHVKNTSKLLNCIIKVIQSLFMSNIILTKKQQATVLEEYSQLVKKNMQLPAYYKAHEIPLLTPKPITLEQVNLVNPDDYGAVSILRGYTVTEKADGERILMYINNVGKVFLINSSLRVEDTGIIAKKDAYNSLVDGEYVQCSKRTDNIKKSLFAAFDIYYLKDVCLTSLPLIDDKKSRNEEMHKFKKLIDTKHSDIEFIIKVHNYNPDIINDCKNILDNPQNYPYEIDGLIFTPAKLAVYSFYPSMPVPVTQNMGWDRLFKWKPPEQNTIDFLVRDLGEVKKNGLKCKKLGLYVGYNPSNSKEITIDEGLRLRYDSKYSKAQNAEYKERVAKKEDFIPILFKPIIYYSQDIEHAYLTVDSKGEVRAENDDKIEGDSIVEFRYDLENKKWIPIRVREDKTRIFKKGSLSKTANALNVAINVWRSIHNPVSKELITGSSKILNKDISDDIQGKVLEADDIYYSRGIPRKSLLSYHMITFHNIGINERLYLKPKHKNNLLELACGQASDMSRWISSGYKFVLGLDLAKDNIYKPNDGAYARVIKEYGRFYKNQNQNKEKVYFLNTAFAVADCSLNIRNGEAGIDPESKELLKVIMGSNSKNIKPHYKYVASKGVDKFDAVSCMFAIHYFFENETKLEGFLKNVSLNLKKDGVFICTFMDGKSVEKIIEKNGNGIAEGKKVLDDISIPVWAIIKRYTDPTNNYKKTVDVFIENTQRLIREYLVNFEFLVAKAKEFNLELEETELYSTTFAKLKDEIPDDEEKQTSLQKSLLELDKNEVQKQFSFLNRWVVFKKTT
jgi:hypothetical protein